MTGNDATAKTVDDAGFTLIELMVVIIIIGILSAIAIPAFLNQRQSAWDGAAKSDLANFRLVAGQYEETQNGTYTGLSFSVATAAPYGFKPSTDEPSGQWTVAITNGGSSYTAQVYSKQYASPGTGHRFKFDSSTGQTTQN